MRKVSCILVCVLLLALAAFAEKKPENQSEKKSEDQYAELSFSVVKADNGKPVRNASIVLHPVDKKGKQESGGLQLKTDSEGRTSFNSVPYGKLRIQVIARGFQTYGEDFDINQPKHDIVVKLNRPKEQYSIYK
jgi:hypothetical protein